MNVNNRLRDIVRDTEKVANELSPAAPERGELLILAARLRAVHQRLTTKAP